MAENVANQNISHNPIQHDKTKHMEVDWYKYNLEIKIIQFSFVKSKNHLAKIYLSKKSGQQRILQLTNQVMHKGSIYINLRESVRMSCNIWIDERNYTKWDGKKIKELFRYYIYMYIYIFFHTAQQNRLVVSKSKISLFQTRVRFLGHYICQGTAKL